MKIAVVGSGGRLGGALVRILGERHEVQGFDRAALDLADGAAIERVLDKSDFEILLTPAALTNVDYCEAHPDEAMAVNAAAPGKMARMAAERGARMIHFSTDYVFGGSDPAARTEMDDVAPLGAYGKSKAAGEEEVLSMSDKFIVARVSWVFGPERPSFLDTIIGRAIANEGVAAIADKVSTPSNADDLVGMVEVLLDLEEAAGLLHLCNTGACTWQEYGQAGIDAALEAGLRLKTPVLGSISLDDIGFLAPRPRFTAMSNGRFQVLTGVRPRSWQEAVRDYVGRFSSKIAAGA